VEPFSAIKAMKLLGNRNGKIHIGNGGDDTNIIYIWYGDLMVTPYVAVDFYSNFLYILCVPNAYGGGDNGWQECFSTLTGRSLLPCSFFIVFVVCLVAGSSSQ